MGPDGFASKSQDCLLDTVSTTCGSGWYWPCPTGIPDF